MKSMMFPATSVTRTLTLVALFQDRLVPIFKYGNVPGYVPPSDKVITLDALSIVPSGNKNVLWGWDGEL